MMHYSLQIYTEGRGWRKVAQFDSEIYVDIFDMARQIAVTPIYSADNVAIVEDFDGEIVWDYCTEREEEEEAGKWDEAYEPDYDECGFNPYEGCYDYDC